MSRIVLLALNILLNCCQGTVLVGTIFSGVLGSRVMRWNKAWLYALISHLISSSLLLAPKEAVDVSPVGPHLLSKSLSLIMSSLGIFFRMPVSPAAINGEFREATYILGFGVLSAFLSFLSLWVKGDPEEPMTCSMKFAPFLYVVSISIPGSLFVFKVLHRFQVNSVVLYSVSASLFVLLAVIVYPLCHYFAIPWFKKRAFAKYPQELLEFASIAKERLTSVNGLPIVDSAILESSDEIDAVTVVRQSGLNLPQSVLKKLMHSPPKRDVEAGGVKRGGDIQTPSSKKESDRDALYKQNERALMTLRSEELYSVGLMIAACLMLINSTQISSTGWIEGSLCVLGGSLGASLGGAMAKHLGRNLMQMTPSSAMLMIMASCITCAIGTVSGLPIDVSTCMTFNLLSLALTLHLRPPFSSRDRRKSDQTPKMTLIVHWKSLAMVMLVAVMSIVVGVSAATSLRILWPVKTSASADLVQQPRSQLQ